MPHWVLTLAAALGAWILLVIVGGFALGRAIDALARRRRRLKLRL